MLYAIQVKKRFNSTNEPLLLGLAPPFGWFYGLFHAGHMDFNIFSLKL
ncbi:hypothetical protein SynMVIR181_01344 [Synechococcus sp. MVIR-18-1]|nr:hypothetical protein SynMVIR181_01344 [Synechococcus sp. MVIR-18-1]